MGKRIVILSDGTGNSPAKIWRTNVWRVFKSLDLEETGQVAYYDDGIGTNLFKPMAILSGMFGKGLRRNVLECYKFLCRNYEPNSEIFLFGFSRGAFTMRVLIELVNSQGIIPYHGNEQELELLARTAFRAYRKPMHTITRYEYFLRVLRDLFSNSLYEKLHGQHVPTVRFVGLWDTVAAYGLPFEELTKTFSAWVYPLHLASDFLPPKVMRVCHALALDEERTTFNPLLIRIAEPTDVPGELSVRHGPRRISEVWFPGVHANVGGGYPDDSLAFISLNWMLKEAILCGMKLKAMPKSDPDSLRQIKSDQDIDGRLYDSRSGLGAYYRYGPRNLSTMFSQRSGDTREVPKIHYSVFERMRRQTHPYAPIGIPKDYSVVTDSGAILDSAQNFETPSQASARVEHQNLVWNKVYVRELANLSVFLVTAYLLIFPFFERTPASAEFTSPLRWLSESIRFFGAFSPISVSLWVNAYAKNPVQFLSAVYLLSSLLYLGNRMKALMSDQMRTIWTLSLAGQLTRPQHNWVYSFRTNPLRLYIREALRKRVIPVTVMTLVLVLGIMLASRALFDIADAAGLYCSAKIGADEKGPVRLQQGEVWSGTFTIDNFCWNSGIWLETGGQYLITIDQGDDWYNGEIAANLNGYRFSDLPDLSSRLSGSFVTPLRRHLVRPFFAVVARIGSVGAEQQFLDPDPATSGKITDVVRARRDGELFLYVNDAVLGLPGLADIFYRDNRGTVLVKVLRR